MWRCNDMLRYLMASFCMTNDWTGNGTPKTEVCMLISWYLWSSANTKRNSVADLDYNICSQFCGLELLNSVVRFCVQPRVGIVNTRNQRHQRRNPSAVQQEEAGGRSTSHGGGSPLLVAQLVTAAAKSGGWYCITLTITICNDNDNNSNNNNNRTMIQWGMRQWQWH